MALESEDCKVLAGPGDVENDATIWIGSMFPLSGADATSYGDGSRDAVDLARRDFAETVGGLPPAQPSGPRRPLAVVSCDDSSEPLRAAAHLVSDVGVPVILGFARSKEVADLTAALFTPKGVLALASNTAPMLSTLPHPPGEPRLVWRTTVGTALAAPALAALLSSVVEPELRAAPGVVAPGEPIRVAFVRTSNASGLGAADAYVSMLRFNGKSVAENGSSYREIVLPDVPDASTLQKERLRVVAEIVAFRPHVVLRASNETLVPEVERAWPATERFRPRYPEEYLTHPDLLAFVRQHPEVRRRLFYIDSFTSTTAMAKLVLRHNQVFPLRPVTGISIVAAPYDAFYVAAYATAALGAAPITGPALARALPRLLPPGDPVDVGPAGMFQALGALGAGKGIDLVGTITSLDFDPETGDPTVDLGVHCLAPTHDGAFEAIESGLVFRARSQKLEGALRCP